MYQVIARKYRPQSFADVVNQEHVKTTLENAIAQNRIAHGYIFSGQRGTGKTTLARILARCLNCVQGPTNQPCGVCASCVEIASGGAMDVIEIDAASNRGINEMRELRENVRYRPARDRYKVFIIDEAHQITNEAFNALLKTIEEPPPWVVFVLCTTEAHKIPTTIASRCQHFSFRSIDFEEIVSRMERICREEGIEADQEALAILAQAGEGSLRDSLSALDQAIARCGAKLNSAEVRSLLGAFSLDSLEQVAQALVDGAPGRMLEIVDDLERNGHNVQHFTRELARYIRNLLVAKIAGSDTRLIAASPAQRQRLANIAAQFSEEDLTRYLQLTLDLFRDLQQSLQPRFHLEIGLVKLVHAGKLTSIEQALANLGGPQPPPKAISARSGAPSSEAPPLPVKQRLHAALVELGMRHTADLIEDSEVTEATGELQFVTPQAPLLKMETENLNQAVRKIIGKPLKIKITAGGASAAEAESPEPKMQPDELSARALSNPEVQKFREVFGGDVRHIRSLKE